MSSRCSACNDQLPHDEDFVKCVFGGCKLHYECAGIQDRTYRQMGAQRRDRYKCRLCRTAGDNASNTGSENDPDDSTFQSSVSASVNPESKVCQPVTLESILARLDAMERSFSRTMKSESGLVQERLGKLEDSVDFCSGKVDDFVKQLEAVNKRLLEAEKNNKILCERNNLLESKMQELEGKVQEMEQYGRRFNIQLDGVPEMEGERPMDIINKLAMVVDEPLVLNSDVQAAHRIPARNTRRPRPLIIQFTNRQKRDAVMDKARVKRLKSTDFVPNVPDTPVYVNDHLTPYYKKVLYEAKRVKREKGYAYLWVKNSKIYARRDQQSQALRLDSLRDVEKL